MAKKNTAQRFREIVRVLAHYGYGYIIDSKIKNTKSSPANLRKAFEELGPTFIKIGQILSTRPDILPSEYIDELQKLQDNTPSVDFSIIKHQIKSEFNMDADDIFEHLEKIPAASASIAQVHRAVLKNHRSVIVKVQRPHIEEDMELDVAILKRILKLTAARFQDALINPLEALDEILASTRKELDFRNEAESINKFYELNNEVRFVGCPKIEKSLSSKRVLTMEYIDGIKISEVDTLKGEGYDLDDIGKKLALSYFKQIFTDGYFHGDPHPGNLLIRGGKIYYIDFGIIGSFTKNLKDTLNEMILALAYRDIDKMIGALLSIGIRKGYVNRNRLYDDIDYLFASYLSVSLENIKMSQMLEEVFDAAKRNNIRLPKDLTLLIRGLVILEGVVSRLSPDIKILDIAFTYIKSSGNIKLLPSFNEFLLMSYSFIKDSMGLPSKIIRLSNMMLDGRLKMQLEHRNLTGPINQLNKMINRLVFALIVSSLVIGSSLILNSNIGPKIFNVSIIGITGFGAAAFLGLWLLISIIKSGKL
jgi:ubiquinone biosynthesis protein